MHFFVSSYFNPTDADSRYFLTLNFIKRYPNVILFEIAFEDQPFLFTFHKNVIQYREPNAFWATNKYFNIFVKEHPELESITFIDSDCIMTNTFFMDVINMHRNANYPLFIQPYSKVLRSGLMQSGSIYEYKENKRVSDLFHTGLAYSYNKKMLEIIKDIPEKLVLGGYDTYLYYSLFKLRMHMDASLDRIENEEVVNELNDFYERFNGIKFNYIRGTIYTNDHGELINRGYNTRHLLYKNINNKVIMDYFISRKE